MREWPGLNTGLGWTAFNLLFISFYQNFLLLSLAFPALYCALSPVSLGLLDLMISLTFLLLVLVETVADNQQAEWRPLIGSDPSRYCALIGCYTSSLMP